jgi:hypothetical protein
MSESQATGVLVCESCGETFPVADGMYVYVDHFEDCEGSDDGEQ